MPPHRAIYRGYAIYVSGGASNWTTRVEPVHPDLPIMHCHLSDGHASRGSALQSVKNEIDRLLSG